MLTLCWLCKVKCDQALVVTDEVNASDAEFRKQPRNYTQIHGIGLACRMTLLAETCVHACSMWSCGQQMMLLPGTSMHHAAC